MLERTRIVKGVQTLYKAASGLSLEAQMAKRAKAKAARPTEVKFDYIKGNLFRVIAMDGAFGGLSPSGREIHMAIFNERRPIPKQTVHPINEEGQLGVEITERRESRSAYVREVEVDLVLDFQTAVTLHIWLQDKIEQMAKVHGMKAETVAKEIHKPNGTKRRKTNG